MQPVVHLAAFPVLPPQGPSLRALLTGKLLDQVPSAPSTVPTYTEGTPIKKGKRNTHFLSIIYYWKWPERCFSIQHTLTDLCWTLGS